MVDTTPRMKLPFMSTAQVQKELTFNELAAMVDALVQMNAISLTVTAPPVSPAEGDTYIIPAAATGVWLDREGQLAYYVGGWHFLEPQAGWLVWVAAESNFYRHDGTSWEATTVTGAENLVDLLDVTIGALVEADDGKVLGYDHATGKFTLQLIAEASVPALADLPDVDVTLGAPVNGFALYYDHATTSFKLQAFPTPSAGATTFLALTDTPANYTGAANKMLVVNGDGNAIVFATAPTAVTELVQLDDFPANYTGHGGNKVVVKGDETGLEFVEDTVGGGGATAFADLTDVDVTTAPPTDGQVPVWDETEEKWVPGDMTGGGGGAEYPAGGSTGQVLAKASGADNDVEWVTVSGGVVGGAIQKRYWRMNGLGSQNTDAYVSASELYFSVDGGTTGLTPTSSSASNSYASGPSILYNGSTADFWAGTGTLGGEWLAFDLGAEFPVNAVKVTAELGNVLRCIDGFQLEYSDTGIGGPWTPVLERFDFAPWTSSPQTISFDTTPDATFDVPGGGTTGQVLTKASDTDGDLEWADPTGGGSGSTGEVLIGAHRYWTLTNMSAPAGNNIIGELEFAATPGGVAIPYIATPSSTYGGFPISNINNGIGNQEWASNGPYGQFLRIDFGVPVEIQEIRMLNVTSTGRLDQQPRSFDVGFSDDNRNFTHLASYVNLSPVADVFTVFAVPDTYVGASAAAGVAERGTALVYDRMANGPNSTSYADAYAQIGVFATATANAQIDAILPYINAQVGEVMRGRLYQVDPTTGAIISLLGETPDYTAATAGGGWRRLRFEAPLEIIAGNTYALTVARMDGTGTTPIRLHFFSGANAYESLPLNIGGYLLWNSTAVQAPAATPTTRTATTSVYSIGAVMVEGLPFTNIVGYGDKGSRLRASDIGAGVGFVALTSSPVATQIDDDTLLFTCTGATGSQTAAPTVFMRDTSVAVAPPYTYARRVYNESYPTNFQGGGLALRDSTTGYVLTMYMQYNSYGGGYRLRVDRWTGVNTSTELAAIALPPGSPAYHRIRDDGTNQYFEYSFGGKVWSTLYQTARTAQLANADQAGVFLEPWYESGSARNPKVVVRSLPSPEAVLPDPTCSISFPFGSYIGVDPIDVATTFPLKLPANFVGAFGKCRVNPSATVVFNVQDDGVTIGTISISTAGALTFATTSGTDKEVASGSILSIVPPGAIDATLSGLTISLAGSKVQ